MTSRYEIAYGAKYTRGMDKREIAKRIRQDIKAAYPNIKTSVRLSRFAGGSSIDVTVKAVDFNIIQDRQFTPEAKALLTSLEAIVRAYNYDGSDTQSDYFNVNFYSNVSFDWTIERTLGN